MGLIHEILTSAFATQTAVISTYVFFISTMVSIGLTVTADEILAALRNHRLMARVMLANIVFVPVLGMVLVKIFPLSTDTQAAILLLASAPGGIQALQFTAKVKGNLALAAAVMFLLSIIAILISPLLVDVILPIETSVTIPYLHAMGFLLLFLLLPLLAGFALRDKVRRIAEGLQKPVLLISNISFVAAIILTMAVKNQATREIGWAALTAMAVLILASMAIGWWLGGPEKGTRRILAISTSMRHAGLSLLIAITCFPGRTVNIAVLAFMALMVPPNMLFTVYHSVRGKRQRIS